MLLGALRPSQMRVQHTQKSLLLLVIWYFAKYIPYLITVSFDAQALFRGLQAPLGAAYEYPNFFCCSGEAVAFVNGLAKFFSAMSEYNLPSFSILILYLIFMSAPIYVIINLTVIEEPRISILVIYDTYG
jgi:hypothetical protein